MTKPVVLIVLDGFGIAPAGPGNAISLAKMPNLSSLKTLYPSAELNASGESVGLPHGENGNTETGHLNLGAGRIIFQDLPRINMSVADGSFFSNPGFLKAIDHARQTGGSLHIMGLVGHGGVHSNMEHLFALLNLCREQKFTRVFVHVFTDGRDSPPRSANAYIEQIELEFKGLSFGQIATVMGRYYAMDRDRRWERTEKAYLALTAGLGYKARSAEEAVKDAYQRGLTDEFIEPTVILGTDDRPADSIKEGDAVIFYNFRIDRPRQLTRSFVLEDLASNNQILGFDPYAVKYHKKHIIEEDFRKPFNRGPKIKNLFFVTMTQYEPDLPAIAAYPPQEIAGTLGEILAQNNLEQLRITETEKERFVTYYFNGQREEPFPKEDRLILPSPKVPTYDLKPEMAAFEVTDRLIGEIRRDYYNFILVNFPNPDMVGHTGNITAAVNACETVDICLGKIVPEVLKLNGACLITADHGNVEVMLDPKTKGADTEHSSYPVPFIAVKNSLNGKPVNLPRGILGDVAPTVLYLLGIDNPREMNGRNLLQLI